MDTHPNTKPLVVIVGETASGKSDLATRLAKQFDGEIIAADSRTVYKGMDIGTAKPPKKEQQLIAHHLVDITTVDKPLTVADYQKLANVAIQSISSRGKLPILVGGSGLYVDAVVYNFSFKGGTDQLLRESLSKLTVKELQNKVLDNNLMLPTNDKNPRHLIRVIESGGIGTTKQKLRPNTLIIGLDQSSEDLKQRIDKRVEDMFANGLEREVVGLAKQFGWEIEPMKTIGYREFQNYFSGQLTLDDLKELIVLRTIQYSKRQKTWFKRNKDIQWVKKQIQAVDLTTTFLNK